MRRSDSIESSDEHRIACATARQLRRADHAHVRGAHAAIGADNRYAQTLRCRTRVLKVRLMRVSTRVTWTTTCPRTATTRKPWS